MVRLVAPLRILLAVLLVAAPGLVLSRVYSGDLLLELVAGAAAASVLISALLRRAWAWLVAPVSVFGLVTYSLLSISVSAHAADVTGKLVPVAADAARNAIPRLLTALIPVEPQPDTVLAPVVLTWLGGLAIAELTFRLRRPALGLLAPTLLYTGALVLVGPNAGAVWWQPLVFVALAALLLTLSSASTGARGVRGVGSRERSALRLRTATGLGAGLVAVLALVGLVAPVVSRLVAGMPTDPREYVQPPSLDVLDENPMIRLSGWAADPTQHLFDVNITSGGAPTPTVTATDDSTVDNGPAYDTRIRLAVLPDWDGITWHMSADYRSAGRVLPPVTAPPGKPVDASAAPPKTVQEQITIDELQGRLLPAISAPRRVDGVRVAYDQSTGTLLRPERLTSGVTYSIDSSTPSVDLDLAQASDVPSGPAVARYLTIGDAAPQVLTDLATTLSTGTGTAFDRALALQSFLSDHYAFATDAPSGHAYPNLVFFLYGDPRQGGQRGTSEQFAAAFAALGRLMGLPTRVVVGFTTPVGGHVTAANAAAWPEVLFDGVGWVAFDPMPDPNSQPQPLEDQFLPKPSPPTAEPSEAPTFPDATFSAPPSTPRTEVAAGSGPGAGVIAGGVGGGVVTLMLMAVALVVALRAAQRRRRLEQGSAPQRVLGAWNEVLDALALAGAPPPAHLAAAEVAGHAATVAQTAPGKHSGSVRSAAPPLDDLAKLVNTVAFADSAVAGATADASASSAASTAVEYASALRARRGWFKRLLWTIDPRPLRRRRP